MTPKNADEHLVKARKKRLSVKGIFSKSNLHIQETNFSCGPSAILNALHLKGDFSHTEKDLIKLCEANPKTGTSIGKVVRASQQVGLKIIEAKQRGTIPAIERNLNKGAYVIVNYLNAYSGHGHYGVITAYDDRAFYFADSAFGLFRLSKKDFSKFWHNTDKTIHRWYMAVQ